MFELPVSQIPYCNRVCRIFRHRLAAYKGRSSLDGQRNTAFIRQLVVMLQFVFQLRQVSLNPLALFPRCYTIIVIENSSKEVIDRPSLVLLA